MGAPQYEQAGADIGGTGTTNTIPRWTGPSTLGDSGLIDDGSAIYTTARNAAFGSTSSAGYRARVLAAAGAGSAFGLRIDAGTNSTDYALRIANQATTSDYLAVRGDGNVGLGTASPQERTQVFGNLKVGVYASGSFISLGDEGTTQKNVGIFRGASVNELQLGGYGGIICTTGAAQLGSQTQRMQIDLNGNIYGTSGTTGMTNGFFYIPAAAGAPTGTPTAVSGRVPMYYDTTNNEFYVYNGAWKKVALA